MINIRVLYDCSDSTVKYSERIVSEVFYLLLKDINNLIKYSDRAFKGFSSIAYLYHRKLESSDSGINTLNYKNDVNT
jgi:hypothetical protein